MQKKNKYLFILGTCIVLLLSEAIPCIAKGPPNPDLLGCTKTDQNGHIIGLPTQICSNILHNMTCTLVSSSLDTVNTGKFKGELFIFDAECHTTSREPGNYHYKTTEITYQEGLNSYNGTHDTFIRPDNPNTVMPSFFAMEVVSRPGPTPWLRGMVRFANQSPIPTNAKILSAELTMVCQEAIPPGGISGHLLGGGMNVGVYGLLKEFNQNEATWNHYSNALTWEIPGAEGKTDRLPTADDTQFILTKCNGVGTDPSSPTGGNVVPTPYTWDVIDSYLEQRTLGKENYGWIFFTFDEDEDAVRFFTHEMSSEFAPELSIKYLE